MSKSLATIARGIARRLSIRASLQSWLGVPITLQDHAFWREFGGSGSFTGKRVSVDQALQLSTASACVRLISETQATLPLGFYQRNANGSRTSATSHPLYEILHNQPNGDMTAVVFWEVVVASMLLWGNAYIEIMRSVNAVVALHFLHPARMEIRRVSNGGYEYWYRDQSQGTQRRISEANMMHVPAFSTDGVRGISPILYGTNVFSTAIETDKASAETFRDAMRSPGIITMDMILKKEQREEIRAHVKTVSDSGGVMVLEKGTGFQKLGFDPESAELLASREFNVEEIARWFRVDPAMIGHGGKDSNWGTGLEQKMIWFLTFTLRPWCVRIEQAVRKSLLTPVERMKYFAEFAIEGLLRADSTARAAFYSSMVNNGIYTRDECRKLENLEPKGGNADVLTIQSAMVDIDDLAEGTNATRPNPLTQALDSMASEIKALANKPPQPINVDARTSVAAPPQANVTVNNPEQPAPVLNIHEGAIVMSAAPVNVAPANVTVHPPAITMNMPEAFEVTMPGVSDLVKELHESNHLASDAAAERVTAATKEIAGDIKALKDLQGADRDLKFDADGNITGVRVKH